MLFEKGSFLRQTGQRVEGRESKSWLVAGVRTEGAGVCDQTQRRCYKIFRGNITEKAPSPYYISGGCLETGDTVVGASQQPALAALVMRLSAAS